MNGLIMGAMVALSMVQAQTDTVFPVDGAEMLSVETLGGSIHVDVWDEDRIRVQAEHSNRTYIEIRRGRRGINIESEARRGPANIVDFRITVPRRMSLDLEAQYGDIVIEGSDGAVKAEALQGDVSILGGRGTIEVSATIGSILVDGADGKIEIESSAADIRVVNSSGEIYAETAGGSVVLENVRPRAVDVGSTGGRVHYDGSFEPRGTYFFGSHGGSVTIVVPDGAAASFNVATVHGSISSNLRGEAESLKGGERHQFQIGGGGALVEAETYGGRIRLLRRGSEGSEAPGPRRVRDDDHAGLMDEWPEDWDHDGAGHEMDGHEWVEDWGHAFGETLGAHLSVALAPAVALAVSPRVSVAVSRRVAAAVEAAVAVEPIDRAESVSAVIALPDVGPVTPPATIRR